MTQKFNWEKANKSYKIAKEKQDERLNNRYKSMAESKWFFHSYNHNCSVCKKEIFSKYPTCYLCFKNRGNLMSTGHLPSQGNGKPFNYRGRIQ